jgi:hypothetical protein
MNIAAHIQASAQLTPTLVNPAELKRRGIRAFKVRRAGAQSARGGVRRAGLSRRRQRTPRRAPERARQARLCTSAR